MTGGITRRDIGTLYPRERPFTRISSTPKVKFGEFESLYKVCLSLYEVQRDPDSFVHYFHGRSYVMYVHFLLAKYHVLSSLALQYFPTEAQREEGVDPGTSFGASSSVDDRYMAIKRRHLSRETIPG